MTNEINDIARYIIEHHEDIKTMEPFAVFNQWSEQSTVTVDEEHIAEFCEFIRDFISATSTELSLFKECISYDGS